jgi:hypothetical protein
VATETLQNIRERIIPMLQYVTAEYQYRVPAGYPAIVDTPERGVVGFELDQSHSLYFTDDGAEVRAEMYYRSPRNDTYSSASRAKFSGLPVDDRRVIDASISDQGLRNLIAELLSRWNFQPLIIHITDTD